MEPLLIVYINVQNTCLIFIVIANKAERFIKFVVCWHVVLKIIKIEWECIMIKVELLQILTDTLN